jgi:oligoendopeptidase F
LRSEQDRPEGRLVDTTATPPEESWDLSDLYADDDAWEAGKAEFRDELLPQVDEHKGRLLSSAETLLEALEANSRAQLSLQRLHCYAALRSDEDTRIAGYQAKRQEIQLLGTDFSRRDAFLRPEILAGDPETLARFLAEEPRLEPYRHYLSDLVRQRKHVLAPGEERIMAEAGLVRGQASTLYRLVGDSELPRPTVELDSGEKVRLTPVAFQKHRTTPNRSDRQRVFPAYFSAYADFRGTLGQNLYALLKEHLFVTRARGYATCLAAALDGDNVPESVYRNLIRQVHEALPVLHRYFRLRARFLGLERLEYPDLYCPLTAKPPRRYSTGQARDLACESLAPLGETYGSALADAFRSRWIDWHPSDGKRSGAYATGSAYEVHPYVLLNHNGDYESVSTLAHEMGHAMHSHFSNEKQPFPTADYSIFVAEVASTFNEALLVRHVLATADSPEAKLYVVGSYLDGIRGTLFRQTMFAEFELEIHERAERGEVLTGEKLDEIYLRLLRQYHGHEAGVVHVAEDYAVEWAAVPHFYYNFYVYQYATGIVAAGALARAVLEGQPGAQERYLRFLGTGGSDYPLELLRRAGVDLEEAAPYRDTFASVGHHLDQLEALPAVGASDAGAR